MIDDMTNVTVCFVKLHLVVVRNLSFFSWSFISNLHVKYLVCFSHLLLIHMHERTIYLPISLSVHLRVTSIVRFGVEIMLDWHMSFRVEYLVIVIICMVIHFIHLWTFRGVTFHSWCVPIIVSIVWFRMHLSMSFIWLRSILHSSWGVLIWCLWVAFLETLTRL